VYEFKIIEGIADRIAERIAEKLRVRVTAVDPEAVAEAIRARLGRIRVSLDYRFIFQTLIALEQASLEAGFYSLWLDPGVAVKLSYTVPRGNIAVVIESRVVCDPDHAIASYIYVDGRPRVYDTDMVQARYLTPLNFMDVGGLVLAREKLEFLLVNKADVRAYISHLTQYLLVRKDVWDVVRDAVVSVIAEELKLPREPARVG
jgi:hypothetical protein